MSDQSDTSQRLNKYVAFHLGLSRREADSLIEKGAVTIGDTPARIGQRVHSGDAVSVSGTPVVEKTKASYVLLHKPVGYVCSRRAQGDAPTIYSLLPAEFHSLKPVGRLDKDSSGVLLLTDDGDMALRMTHPRYAKRKVYEVRLDHVLAPLHHQMINDFGVMLDDGKSQFVVQRLDETDQTSTSYQVTMAEGRNRQIRRTFAALGYTVTQLHRTQFGEYSLGDIQPGTYKLLVTQPVIYPQKESAAR